MTVNRNKTVIRGSVVLILLLFAGLLDVCRTYGQLSGEKNAYVSSTGKWPAYPLRGVNTKLVFPVKKNKANPGGFLSDEIFRQLKSWRVNVIRVAIGVDENSAWDV